MTATDDSAGRQGPGPGYGRPLGGTGYDAYGRPVHPGWTGPPSPYDRPEPARVPLPLAPAWLPMAVLGVGVVAAFLATLNRPGLGLVITGVVAGLTALAALMVRPAIPESGVPPEASEEDDHFPEDRIPPEFHGHPEDHEAWEDDRAWEDDGFPEDDGPPEDHEAPEDEETPHAEAPGSDADAGHGESDEADEAAGTSTDPSTQRPDVDHDVPDTDPDTADAAEPAAEPESPAPDGAAPGHGAGSGPGSTWNGPQARPGYAGPAQHSHGDSAPDHPQPGYPASGHTDHSAHAAYAGHPGHSRQAYPAHPGYDHPGYAAHAYAHHAYAGPGHRPAYGPPTTPPAAPARPDRYAYTWSAIFGVLAVVLLATAALRDAGWVLVWTLTGSFLLASMAFATRNPAARQSAVGVATGAFAVLRNLPATPRFLLSPLDTRRASGLALPIVVTSMVTVGLLLVFGLLFALADPVFAAYLGQMFTSVGTGSGVLRLVAMLVTVLLTGAAVLTARRYHRQRPRPVRPAADPLWPVWVWTVPLTALVALFVAFVGVQAAVMFGGDDYVQRVAGVIYAEYARQGFFQLVVVSVLVLGVIAVAVRLLPSRVASTRTLRNALLGLLCVLTLVILASAMMRLQLYIDTFGLTRLRVSAEAWILWSAGVFGLVIAAGVGNTLGRSAAWLPRVTVAFGAAALAVFAYGNPDLRIAESHHDLDLRAVDTHYLSMLSADAVPGLMGLPEDDRLCALVGLRDRLDDPDGRGVAAWNLSRVQGRQQLAELGLFNDVSRLDCGVRTITTY